MLDQLLYGGAKPFQSSVWIKLTPLKVQLFLWLVVQDNVTTRDFLFWHDYLTLQESRCAFCNKSLESSSHLFIHCHFTWNIWMKLLFNQGFCSVFPKYVDDMCYQWSFMVKGKQKISHDNFFPHTLYGIFNSIGMTSFLMTFPLTSKFVSLWCAKVLLYG